MLLVRAANGSVCSERCRCSGMIVRKLKFNRINATQRDELHLLPVDQRIEYRLSACFFAFNLLSAATIAPAYLLSLLITFIRIQSRHN